MQQRPDGPPWQDAQRELNNRMETAVSAMVDPEAWDLASSLAQQVTLDRYNWAKAARRFLGSLRESNPGAVIWLFAFCRYQGPVNHPGQVIAAARSHLEQNGLEPRNWRAATRLRESVMKAATEWPWPETTAARLNAVAESGCVPSLQAVRAVNMVIGRQRSPREQDEQLREDWRRNVRRAMALAFQGEAQNGPAPARGLTAAADYAGALARGGRELSSTTWGGLSKAARRWRREMTEEMLRDQWAQLMTQREGRIQAWTSLFGETRTKSLAAVPITSEYGLYQESIAMGPCDWVQEGLSPVPGDCVAAGLMSSLGPVFPVAGLCGDLAFPRSRPIPRRQLPNTAGRTPNPYPPGRWDRYRPANWSARRVSRPCRSGLPNRARMSGPLPALPTRRRSPSHLLPSTGGRGTVCQAGRV